MSPIRVMHLLPSNRLSGAENVILQIMELFNQDSNYEMFYVSTEGPIRSILESKNIAYHLLPDFTLEHIKQAVTVCRPDIIHAHDFRASVMASKFFSPIIAHLHNNPPWLKHITPQSLAFGYAIRKFKTVLGVSSAIQQEYIFKFLLTGKFNVFPNVLNAPKILEKSEQYTVQDKPDLLFVGRLTQPKNPLKFLEIIRELTAKDPTIMATMIGEGELKPQCEKYIQKYRLYNNVKMPGFLENPYPYMKQAKLLVLPSLFEGFGLVAVEAFILGTPVICSGVGGLKGIVNSSCGAIAKTTAEYVNQIQRLLNNHDLLTRCSHAAEQRATQYTNLQQYKTQLDCYYHSALNGI